MKIRKLFIAKSKSIKDQNILASQSINIIVGKNNSGKTTILESIRALNGNGHQNTDSELNLKVSFFNDGSIINGWMHARGLSELEFDYRRGPFQIFHDTVGSGSGLLNIVGPWLHESNISRNHGNVQNALNFALVDTKAASLNTLATKHDAIYADGHPLSAKYRKAIRDILGLDILSLGDGTGKLPGIYLSTGNNMKIVSSNEMGTGVNQVLMLVLDIIRFDNMIFIIDQIEADLHPEAIKVLCKLVKESSQSNQFFISTHSSIVLKELGGGDSKVFQTTLDMDSGIPNTQIKEIDNDPAIRLSVLEDLGYDATDFMAYKGWLVLEEASADLLLREGIIPAYFEKLSGLLRVRSSGGFTKASKNFEDLNNLFVYAHLENATYKNRVWVVFDQGENEKAEVNRLQEIYKVHGWNENTFRMLSRPSIEDYYPAQFKNEVEEIKNADIKVLGHQKLGKMKVELAKKVAAVVIAEPDKYKKDFQELLELLAEIQTALQK